MVSARRADVSNEQAAGAAHAAWYTHALGTCTAARAAPAFSTLDLTHTLPTRAYTHPWHRTGDINDIRLITDRHTKRSKGLAYIEFAVQDSIYAALALSGQTMNGQAIMVKTAEAEKNLAWEAQQAAKQNATDASSLLGAALLGGLPGAAPPGAGPCKLQVNGFAPGLGEEPLKQLFAPFGAIDKVELVRDAAGTPVGYGYITFKNYGEGMTAQAHWHGKQFLNSTLTVEVAPVAPAEGGPTITPAGEIDDEDAGGGLKLSSQARTALMNRLAGSAGMPTAPLPGPPAAAPPLAPADAALLLEQGVLGPPSPIPTPCLLLKNMFDPSEAGDDPAAFEVELKEDVGGEASKFGELLHIYVDLDTPNKVCRGAWGPCRSAGACGSLLGGLHATHVRGACGRPCRLHSGAFSACSSLPLSQPAADPSSP